MHTLSMMLLIVGGLIASVQAQADTASLRVAHLSWDAPPVTIYIDDVALPELILSPFLSRYTALEAGDHTLALVPEGEELDAALIGPLDITLERDHAYTLATIGRVDDSSLQTVWIDETELIAGMEPTATEAVLLLVNGLQGAAAVDGVIDGDLMFDDLAFGEFAAASIDIGWRQAQFFVEDGAYTTLFDLGPGTFFGTPYTLVFAAAVGSWPGELFLNNNVHIWPLLTSAGTMDTLSAMTDASQNGIDPFTEFGSFSTLIDLINAAGIADQFSHDGPYTLFAPTDAAFDALPDGMLDELRTDPVQLANLLYGHIVRGTELPLPDNPGMALNGRAIEVTFPANGPPIINDSATFTGQIFPVADGQIVLIDAVLLGGRVID